MSEREVAIRINQRLQEAGLLPRDPLRFRYFQKCNGPMFCWTVERDPDGDWYYSFVYKPVGKGSRSDAAELWDFNEKTLRKHRKRKDAKARALKLCQVSLEADHE